MYKWLDDTRFFLLFHSLELYTIILCVVVHNLSDILLFNMFYTIFCIISSPQFIVFLFVGRNGLSVFQMLAAKHNWVITHVDYFVTNTNSSDIDVHRQLNAIKNKGNNRNIINMIMNDIHQCTNL